MAARPKENIDGTMDGEKALNLPWGLKAAHLALALARRLMRDFNAIVCILRDAVTDRGEGGPVGGSINAQLIGDQSVWDVP